MKQPPAWAMASRTVCATLELKGSPRLGAVNQWIGLPFCGVPPLSYPLIKSISGSKARMIFRAFSPRWPGLNPNIKGLLVIMWVPFPFIFNVLKSVGFVKQKLAGKWRSASR